jgi:hypothetical protein
MLVRLQIMTIHQHAVFNFPYLRNRVRLELQYLVVVADFYGAQFGIRNGDWIIFLMCLFNQSIQHVHYFSRGPYQVGRRTLRRGYISHRLRHKPPDLLDARVCLLKKMKLIHLHWSSQLVLLLRPKFQWVCRELVVSALAQVGMSLSCKKPSHSASLSSQL